MFGSAKDPKLFLILLQVALLNTGPSIGNQSSMAKAPLALPAPKTHTADLFKNWIAESTKHTMMKNLDS